tara:strand:+ start:789 stop:2141 length:1353 start_codon:yes stop_codon:yes gene_type:complete
LILSSAKDFKNIFKESNNRIKGINFFRIGVFLLPSAFYISTLFILIASITNCRNRGKKLFINNWNYPLYLSTILILLSCFNNYLSFGKIEDLQIESKISIFLDIANWVPFFYIFISCRSFLSNTILRRDFSMLLISGSFPILLSGFYQYFLFKLNFPESFYGPYQILRGLIVWYQRPININGETGITSIFNNPNYLGCWLIVLLPFSISLLFEKNKGFYKKIISLIFLLSIIISIVLTKSKAAINLLALSIPITFNFNLSITIFLLIFFFISTGIIIYMANSDFSINLEIIPKAILNDYSRESLSENLRREFRFNIWINAINFIKIDPIFGLGAGIFPMIYLLRKGNWVAHTHNLFLELAFNHGILVAFTIIVFIVFLIFKSFYTLKESLFRESFNNNFLNKTWWSSTVLLILSQMVDLQYYDGRVSMTLWLLLSGLLSIIQEKEPTLET